MTSQTDAARDEARRASGEFGEQLHAHPGTDIIGAVPAVDAFHAPVCPASYADLVDGLDSEDEPGDNESSIVELMDGADTTVYAGELAGHLPNLTSDEVDRLAKTLTFHKLVADWAVDGNPDSALEGSEGRLLTFDPFDMAEDDRSLVEHWSEADDDGGMHGGTTVNGTVLLEYIKSRHEYDAREEWRTAYLFNSKVNAAVAA